AYDFDNRKTGKLSEYRKSSLVPYLGITFDVDKNHSLYANYTQIKKPQTNRDMDNNLLNPITGTNTEIGFKSDWFGNGRL
ncbi:TonB-dependent receptor domain-containing protein, partial [Neisseria sp. P0001.S010]